MRLWQFCVELITFSCRTGNLFGMHNPKKLPLYTIFLVHTNLHTAKGFLLKEAIMRSALQKNLS